MSGEHIVYVNPRYIKDPHDVQHRAGCFTCGWKRDTVTVEHAKLLAIVHKKFAPVALAQGQAAQVEGTTDGSD